MSLPQDLLDQAAHLATRERKRPKQASLRRSISGSYYAVFHHLTWDVVETIGPYLGVTAKQRLVRWLDHGEMKRVCGVFLAPVLSKQIQTILAVPIPSELRIVCQAFIRLQEARHNADYNLAMVWTRLTAQQYVDTARNAMAQWDSIQKTHEINVFALAMLSTKLFERER